jgi:hypothetical protein
MDRHCSDIEAEGVFVGCKPILRASVCSQRGSVGVIESVGVWLRDQKFSVLG